MPDWKKPQVKPAPTPIKAAVVGATGAAVVGGGALMKGAPMAAARQRATSRGDDDDSDDSDDDRPPPRPAFVAARPAPAPTPTPAPAPWKAPAPAPAAAAVPSSSSGMLTSAALSWQTAQVKSAPSAARYSGRVVSLSVDWASLATRLARYTVPRCWVPHNSLLLYRPGWRRRRRQ